MNDNADSSNYFVLNPSSKLWDGTPFDEGRYVDLPADASFTLKKKIAIPLKLSDFDPSCFQLDETIAVNPDKIISFDLDKYGMLYILDKNSKKIRRLSVYDYERLDDEFGSEYQPSDEYVAVCKGLDNPKTVSVSRNYIFVLESSVIYVVSKTNHRLVKTMRFNDDINIFKVTEDEKVIFYSYSDDKTVLFKKNLEWGTSPEDEKENQIINLSDNVILDLFTQDNESNESYGPEGRNYQGDVGGGGYEDSGQTNDFYVGSEKFIRNIIDIAINNRQEPMQPKYVCVLTYGELFTFDFDGNQIRKTVNLKENESEDYDPTSLTIDEENNDIFIGNVTRDNHQAFPRKLRTPATEEKDKKPILEKIQYQGQSRKLFFTRINEAGKSVRRIILFNILRDENRSTIEDNISNNSVSNVRKADDDDLRALGRMNNASGNPKNMICDILEERTVYKSESPVTLVTKPLDTISSNTRWSKVAMEFDAPPNTFVKLSYFCFNDDEVPNIEAGNWNSGPVNSKNVLILDCVGRYLKLKVELSSMDERSSPRFYKMIAYFSVPSYLRYLPYIYQEDGKSKEFLERFLAVFQTLFEDTQGKVFSFANLLDVKTTPDEFLPWLASWMSVGQSEEWSPKSMRLLLNRAPEIFRKRGTRGGLELILSIYLQSVGGTIFIIDEKKELNELYSILKEQIGEVNLTKALLPYCFYVLLNPLRVDDRKVYFLKRIVEKEKPAHTVGIVKRLSEHWILGNGNFLGVNTVIREKVDYILGENFILGKSFLSVKPLLTPLEKES